MPTIQSTLYEYKLRLKKAEEQLNHIDREEDYELKAHYAESDEQQQRFKELAERQNTAREKLEDEIYDLRLNICALEDQKRIPVAPGGPLSADPDGASDDASDDASVGASNVAPGKRRDEPPQMTRANATAIYVEIKPASTTCGGGGGCASPVETE